MAYFRSGFDVLSLSFDSLRVGFDSFRNEFDSQRVKAEALNSKTVQKVPSPRHSTQFVEAMIGAFLHNLRVFNLEKTLFGV
jgi:hypothetical protein